jgi:hypothetical protein
MTTKPEWQRPRPERLAQPSYGPPVMALGLMCLLWGAVTTWIISVAGAVLVGTSALKWIASLRRER